MTGHPSEGQLALYAFGDAGRERDAISAHVERCAGCQRVLEEFRLARDFVGAALQDPTLDELVEVRAGVLRKLQPAPGKRSAWWLAGAAAAALALLLPAVYVGPHVVSTGRTKPVVAQRIAITKVDEMARVSAAKPRVVVRVRHRGKSEARLHDVTLIAGAQQPATLKMATGDPNVVILLQMSEGEENR